MPAAEQNFDIGPVGSPRFPELEGVFIKQYDRGYLQYSANKALELVTADPIDTTYLEQIIRVSNQTMVEKQGPFKGTEEEVYTQRGKNGVLSFIHHKDNDSIEIRFKPIG